MRGQLWESRAAQAGTVTGEDLSSRVSTVLDERRAPYFARRGMRYIN